MQTPGHEHPAIRRSGGEYELVEYRHSPAVATMEGIRFKKHEFGLHPGDSLFVYTDGVPEATDALNELFGEKRTPAALNHNATATPEALLATCANGSTNSSETRRSSTILRSVVW